MDPSPLRDALTVGLGVVTGMMSGAFGVGGAVISTPGIRLLGADAKTAVGTTLPCILPSAISGGTRYARAGLVEWRAVRLTAPLGMVAAAAGAQLVEVLPGDGHPLQILTALLLVLGATRLIRGAQTSSNHPLVEHPNPAGLAAVGTGAGFLSGLLGIGGGVFLVSGFHSATGMPIKKAVGTSLVCIALFAVPGIAVHALNGNIDWRFAVWLTVGAVPGARIGSALAMRVADRKLQVAVGWTMGLLAVPYIAGELLALR